MQMALQTLSGILKGIDADNIRNARELSALHQWLSEHEDMSNRHPFCEIFDSLVTAMDDDELTREEIEDVLWLCDRYADGERFAGITCEMQELQGMLGGIVADGVVAESELKTLGNWINEHDHMKGCWPFDEIESLVTAVRRDGKIDEREQRMLLAYFGEWSALGGQRAIGKQRRGGAESRDRREP